MYTIKTDSLQRLRGGFVIEVDGLLSLFKPAIFWGHQGAGNSGWT